MTARLDLPLAIPADIPNAATSRRKIFVSNTTGKLATKDDAGTVIDYTDDTVVSTHIADTTNPHAVTAAQVGSPTTAAFNAHTTDATVHQPVGTTDGEISYWNGTSWALAAVAELKWDTSGVVNRLRVHRLTVADRIHVTDDGQIQLGGHGGDTLGDYIVDIQGGTGDQRLIQGRRDNALGGGFQIQAGNGDVGLYLTSPSYARSSGGHFVADQGATGDRLFIGAGDLNKSSSAIVVTDTNEVRIQSATVSTSATTGAFTVVGGVGIGGDTNISGLTTISDSNSTGALIVNNTSALEHSVAEFRGDKGKRIRIRNKDQRNYIGWTGSGQDFLLGEDSNGLLKLRMGSGTDFSSGTLCWEADLVNGQFNVAVDTKFSDDIDVTDEIRVGGFTDTDYSCIVKPGTDPTAFIAAADVAGKDTYIRTQDGGAHTANNPRGGDIIIVPGAAGTGGTGRAGRVEVQGEVTVSGNIIGAGYLEIADGMTAPLAGAGARLFVDSADGDLKVIFADGTTKTIVADV